MRPRPALQKMGVGVLVLPLVGLITSLTTLTASQPLHHHSQLLLLRQDSFHHQLHQRNILLHDDPQNHHHNVNIPLQDDPLHHRHHHHTPSNTTTAATITSSPNDTSAFLIDNSGNDTTLPVTYSSGGGLRKRDKPLLSDDDEERNSVNIINNSNDDDATTPDYDDNTNTTQTRDAEGRNASPHTDDNNNNNNSTKFDYDDGRNTSEGDGGEEEEYTPYDQRPETYLVPCVFAVIFVTGVVGNGALIFMFLKHPKLRSTPNTHLVSLAAGDLLMVLLTVPFTSLVYTLSSYPFGETVCRASEFAKDLSLGITVFTLTALSADRYLAIVRPVSHHVSDSAGKLTLAVAVGIWVVSAALATPAAIFSKVPDLYTPTGDKYHICTPFPSELGPLYPKIHTLVKVGLYYLLPLILIGSFYILMARHLMKSAQHMPGEAAGLQRRAQARRKVAKMVLAFVTIFAICFLPLNVFTLWWHFNPNSEDDYDIYWHYFRIVGFCLSFANSCINPVALYFVSGTFRKYFNRHVFCWCAARGAGGGWGHDVDTTGTRATRTEHLPMKTVVGHNGTHQSTVTRHHHHPAPTPPRLTLTTTTTTLITPPHPHSPSVL